MIEKIIKADCVIQVENGPNQLKDFLRNKGISCEYKSLPPTDYNTRRKNRNYDIINQDEWDNLSQDLKDRLDRFCEKYGYDKIKYTND